ncbi:MAG: sigma-70 family RNA polymerase sigma factor [Verrucomicrobiales bacterium]|nr:sigma-70 family RNA polymerase sigma factor [Verrucomicrobiales bacterium]
MTSDLDLLGQFAREKSQDAFTALVQRHVNLVHSAALRQVRSPQLAEEVAQSVFADLARNAGKLKPDTILTAWLYRVTCRTAIDVVRKESRRQLREQIAVEMTNMNATANDWTQIEPLLDDAMAALDETDRSAILLRFFENKTLREVGEALGTNDDAAQKRVSRAVERLREFFSKRNVTIGAGGIAVVISANAVQAAPVGLAVTISAGALAGTVVHTSAIIAATKTIAMTTLQKTLVTATVAVLAGAGIYEARQAAQLRELNQTLQQQQAPLAEQIQQLQREHDDATNRLTSLLAENNQLKSNPNQTELWKLRGEVTRLRNTENLLPTMKTDKGHLQTTDPNWQPNWIALKPVDLAQFSDSTNIIVSRLASDAGTSTPAALLQTWIWAQCAGNIDGILRTWEFPDGTSQEAKLARVKEAQNDEENARMNPDQIQSFEKSKLRDLFSLGNERYLAFIEENSPGTGTWISHQILQKVGDEWKIEVGNSQK